MHPAEHPSQKTLNLHQKNLAAEALESFSIATMGQEAAWERHFSKLSVAGSKSSEILPMANSHIPPNPLPKIWPESANLFVPGASTSVSAKTQMPTDWPSSMPVDATSVRNLPPSYVL
jgi:hypothetical protein